MRNETKIAALQVASHSGLQAHEEWKTHNRHDVHDITGLAAPFFRSSCEMAQNDQVHSKARGRKEGRKDNREQQGVWYYCSCFLWKGDKTKQNPMDRTHLYKLIIGQLKADGYHSIGSALERETNIVVPDASAERDALSQVLCSKKSAVSRLRKRMRVPSTGPKPSTEVDTLGEEEPDPDMVLEFNDRGISVREGPGDTKSGLETKFITTHKKFVRCARFSPDGAWVATGSEDTSIKVLDVEKMKNYNDPKVASSSSEGADGDRSHHTGASGQVARPFYDHRGPVTDLEFHPFLPVLFSASKDCSIRMYDISQSSLTSKRSFKALHDTHPVRSISVHPAGEHLLVASANPVLRVYDILTGQVMIGSRWAEESHSTAINQIRYSPNGRQFASAGKDGDIRIWDGTSNLCTHHIPHAHKGFEVSSVTFSRNNYYLLSGGKDSTVRLWDLRMGKQLKTYVGSQQSKTRVTSAFSYNEDYVLSSDETTSNLVVWNAHTGELVDKLSGHAGAICWVATSHVELAALSCSLDSRARFWALNTNDMA